MFVIGDVFGSVFEFGDVFGSARFESSLQSDVKKQLFCYLVMFMNCFSVSCLEACFILVTSLGVCLTMVTCEGSRLSLVLCMDYTSTDC